MAINTLKYSKKIVSISLYALCAVALKTFAVDDNAKTKMIDLPPLPTISAQINDQNASQKGSVNTTVNSTNASSFSQSNISAKGSNDFTSYNPWQDPNSDPDDPNFQLLLKEQFPMSPDQIKTFRDTLDIYQRALQNKAKNPAPVMSTRSVNLAPGSVPPPVRIATGYVSSILFIDETGAPWPIKAYDIGNSKAFDVVWDKVGNLLLIQGLEAYANTNIVVLLHNLETPVILNLVNDQQKVDYRMDLRIPGMGPKANVPIITNSSIPDSDEMLMGLLDGIPPDMAKPLAVKGASAQAWLLDDRELLIRTRLTILSPAYTSSMRSPDGMKVYRLPKTPLIMASKDGNTYQLSINGY